MFSMSLISKCSCLVEGGLSAKAIEHLRMSLVIESGFVLGLWTGGSLLGLLLRDALCWRDACSAHLQGFSIHSWSWRQPKWKMNERLRLMGPGNTAIPLTEGILCHRARSPGHICAIRTITPTKSPMWTADKSAGTGSLLGFNIDSRGAGI